MTTTKQLTNLFDLLNKLRVIDNDIQITPMLDETSNTPILNVYMNDYGCSWNFNIVPNGMIHIEEFSEDNSMNGTQMSWSKFVKFLLDGGEWNGYKRT